MPELGHPPELAAVAAQYAHELERVMETLHRLSAAALGLADDFFDSPAGTTPTALLVISHYPPLSELGAREDGKPRYRAHSDYTGFTILLQDESDHGGPSHDGSTDTCEPSVDGESGGGLEIDIGGNWTPVVPRRGSFIVNIGDLFELWTNDRWRSTPHRVASPRLGTAASSRSRLTAMLFTGPALETVVRPAPTCGAPRYTAMTARDHLARMAISKSKEAHYKRAAGNDGIAEQPRAVVAPAVRPQPSKSEMASFALPVACGAGHIEVAQLLLDAGPSREAMELAIQSAEQSSKHECARLVRRALEREQQQAG